MTIALLCILFMLISASTACRFYFNTAPTQTFISNETAAFLYAMEYQLTMHVCQATIISNQSSIPPIDRNIDIKGDVDPVTGEISFLTIEYESNRALFVITQSAVITITNLQIIAINSTIFLVRESSQLRLSNVTMYYAFMCIYVSGSSPSARDEGFEGSNVWFENVGYALVRERGFFSCRNCHLIAPRNAGFVSIQERGTPLTNILLFAIEFKSRSQPLLAYQSSISSIINPLNVTAEFGPDWIYINKISYSIFESECTVCPEAPVLGGGQQNTTATCDGNQRTRGDYILRVATFAAILVAIAVIALMRSQIPTTATVYLPVKK